MSNTKRPIVPDGDDTFTGNDFATATDRVKAICEAALADPDIAQTVESKTASIA